MDEKHEKILEFFKDNNIELPIDVKNALEDVFVENDGVDSVDIYFKEDINEIGEDLIIVNEVNAYLDKPSSGSICNTFTYYGEVEYSVSEFVKLLDSRNNILEEITLIDNQTKSTTINPLSYVVVLKEIVEWVDGNIKKEPRLFIYCPESSEGE